MLSGVGALLLTVDTSLEKKELAPGEEMRGVVEVKGGGTEQEVKDPYVYVQTHYKRESGDTPVSEAGTVESSRLRTGCR